MIARSSTATEASRSTFSQCLRNDFVKIGVLYLKLVTKIEEDVYESEMRVSFINIDDNECVDLLEFNANQMQEIGKKRVDLTVYCNLEQIYTFVLNYLVENVDPSTLNFDALKPEELLAMIKAYKKENKHREWFVLLAPLLAKRSLREDQLRPLLIGLDTKAASSDEIRRLQGLMVDAGVPRLKEALLMQPHLLKSSHSHNYDTESTMEPI